MHILLYPFIGLAALGLVVSIIVHVLAHLGYAPFGASTFVLHVGIFVVWIPAVLSVMRSGVLRIYTSMNPRAGWRSWKQIVRGSPRWMQWMTAGFFIYGFANFFLFIALGLPAGSPRDNTFSPTLLWGFSGHWMIFYSAALTIMYSAVKTNGAPLRCPAGHLVSPMDSFCPECGTALASRSSVGTV
jgi:hypothetical protein